jgi:hypothetical protein
VALKSGIVTTFSTALWPILVGGTVNLTATDPATSHEAGKTGGVVIAAVIGVDFGGAAKLGGQYDESVLQHASGLQILQQGAECGIEFLAEFRNAGEISIVGVPTAEGDFHEPHPVFDEAAGEQTALAEAVGAVFAAQGVRTRR